MLNKLLSSKVVKNSGWIIGGKIVQMILGFIIGIFTARYLGPSNYGIINTAQAYTAFIMPVCTLGFSAIFVKCILDHPSEEGKYLSSGIAIRCLVSIIMMMIMFAIVILVNPNEKELHLVFFIHSFVLFFQSFDLFDYWYQSKYQSKYPTIYGIIGYFVAAVYKLFLLITGKSVAWFAFATVLDYAIVAIMYLTISVKRNHIKMRVSWSVAKDMINVSKHFILSGMLVMVYAQMDKIMIGKFLSNTEVGLYSVGVAICNLWTFVITAIINSVRPNIVETFYVNKEKYKKKLVSLYSLIIWLSIAVSLVLCCLAKLIIIVLYGNQYLGAIGVLRIITWYTSFSFLGVARNIWTVCEEKQKYEKFFALSGAIGNFVLNIVLIPTFGINGAAIASLATQIITNVIVPYCIKDTRENSIHIIKAFNPKNLLIMR